jgi:SAM-dependent methyltransferase
VSELDRARWNEKHAGASRHEHEHEHEHEPEPFVVAALKRVAELHPSVPRTALDVACGGGRHAIALARAGLDVLAVDASDVALDLTMRRAGRESCAVRAMRRDLDEGLPRGRFGVVLCTRFLDRRLWPALREAAAPGGLLVFQTFVAGRSGMSERFCLREDELRRELAGFEMLAFERDPERGLDSAVARRPCLHGPARPTPIVAWRDD